ncbi:hypothetical protein UFOVP1344_12 [uncultured Caudovirales phage]|uniref:Uncharacterized protein n=1 Tax=uncultured Caudovirales phage TaxID=2100421 RepID=A0A6J5SSX6_9CAUD|nr:hypothetical protein UFOVP1005_12 [uncultured Caudovirales phage]CAB4199792.1 hypothetical protein UFOVP1344_12 [uncultured Caudovirales phage]CAB4218409.1 hypothetical protein UFOVP1602_28 [uncultured Caudovirales phage]
MADLALAGTAAHIALAKMREFVGSRATNELYRETITRMVSENLVPNDIVGAVFMGIEIGADMLERELHAVGKEDLNVQRTY